MGINNIFFSNGVKRKLNYLKITKKLNNFICRRLVFFKKKKPSSKTYPFQLVDPLYVFDDISGNYSGYGRLHLVGENWLDKGSNKPIAIMVGFNDWKYGFVASYLSGYRVAFFPRKTSNIGLSYKMLGLKIKPDVFIVWGYTDPVILKAIAKAMFGIPIMRMEDGFVRSAELGATHSTPYSLVLDKTGLYYDPRSPSDIEVLLNTWDFKNDKKLMQDARSALNLILDLKITKYNNPTLKNKKHDNTVKIKKRIAILGQVDNDVSIKLGNPDGWTAEALIELAAYENIEAEILYRPHPDIYHGFQKSKLKRRKVEQIATIVSPDESLIDFLESVDHVYTITSLSGLEALIRGKKVTIVGLPFYSGWGLTDDRIAFPRRKAKLTLLELFAGVYLKYPVYLASSNALVGLTAACYRIVADNKVGMYQLHKDEVKRCNGEGAHNDERFSILARSDYWPLLFFQKEGFESITNNVIQSIDFSSLFYDENGPVFQYAMLYMMCGVISEDSARNFYLEKVRSFIDITVLNDFLLDLQVYFPGSYVDKQFAWLLSENEDDENANEVINQKISEISSFRKNKLQYQKKAAEVTGDEAQYTAEPAELYSGESIDMDEAALMKDQLFRFMEQKNYDDAQRIIGMLLLTGYWQTELLLVLIKIARLKFDFVSARLIATFLQKIDIHANNRNANYLQLENISIENPDLDELLSQFSVEIKLNPERVNKGFPIVKKYISDEAFTYKVFSSMLALDNRQSFQKAIAYLEVVNSQAAQSIIENLLLDGKDVDILKNPIRITYSRVLAGLGEYDKAIKVIKEVCDHRPIEGAYTHYLRLLKYVGEFEEARRIAYEAERKGFELGNELILPIYQGLREIEKSFKLYRDVPSRDLLISYFPSKYVREKVFEVKKLLILADYGPGDEIRFASIYGDLVAEYGVDNFRVVCDFRLKDIMERSYPNINFVPVKRTSDYGPDYPLADYNNLPGSDLCRQLDNNGLIAIEEADKIILIQEMLWHFRKNYRDFPGKPFLIDNKERTKYYEKLLPVTGLLVGLCWRSHLSSDLRNVNYVKVEQLEMIFNIEGITFVNLQYDRCEEELSWVEEKYPGKLLNISELDQMNDLDGVASLIACLDLVIAPPVTVAELSGALGRDTFLLANHGELLYRNINKEGGDLWQNSVTHIKGSKIGDKESMIDQLVKRLQVLGKK